MERLVRLYDKRIVNVNVNIVLAGVLALAFMAPVMHGLSAVHVPRHIAEALGMPWAVWKFRFDEKAVIGGLSLVVDLVADVVVYYVLHWVANHMPRRARSINPAYAHLSFMQDATMVQVERMTLSPLFYIIALGVQHALLHAEMGVGWASAFGFGLAIVVTRILHTIWMVLQERRMKRRLEEQQKATLAGMRVQHPPHTPRVRPEQEQVLH